MKKIIALLAAAVFMSALFVGCAASPEGFYRLETLGGKNPYDFMADELGGDRDSLDQMLGLLGIDKDDVKNNYMTITLSKDGSAKLTHVLDEEDEIGTWKLDGKVLTISEDNGDSVILTVNGDTLLCEIDGSELVFKKQ